MKVWIVSALMLAACGSSGNGSGGTGGSGGNGPCSITISGATSATLSCQASSVFDASHNRGSVTLGVPNAAPLQSVILTLSRPGEVMTGAWANTDAGAMGGIDVIALGAGSPAWVASQASPNSQGSYTMDLTTANVTTQTSNAKTYVVHGTIDATLLPIPGTNATGNVTFHATF